MALEIINVETDRAGGAVLATHQFEWKSDKPVHGFRLTMQFLQDGATLPTIANVLTQMATDITVRQGGMWFSMSATDLYHFLRQASGFNYTVHQSDGTGADNHSMSISLDVPLAPLSGQFWLDEEYGLDPANGTIVVELTVPADANNLDTRKYTLTAFSLKGKNPTKCIQRVSRNLVPAGTGDGSYIDLPSGGDVMLYDIAFFHTTALTAGTTSDVTTIESLSLEINQTEAFVVDLFGLATQVTLGNLSLAATSPAEPATYIYQPLNPIGRTDWSIPLTQKARFNINAGDTNAIRCLSGIIRSNRSGA